VSCERTDKAIRPSQARSNDTCRAAPDVALRLETHARPSLTNGANDGCEVAAPATPMANTGANAARKLTPMRLRATAECFRAHTCSLPSLHCQHLRQRFSVVSLKPVSVRGFREADRAVLGKRDTAPRGTVLPMNAAIDNFSPADEKRSPAIFPAARVGHCPRRALFVHQGFCRPRLTSIQSRRSERMNDTDAPRRIHR
jgi:hypothetical protein